MVKSLYPRILYLSGIMLLSSACASVGAGGQPAPAPVVAPAAPAPTTVTPPPAPAAPTPTRVAQRADQPLGQRADVREFIGEMAARHGFDPVRLQALFNRVQVQPSIIAAMDRPAEAKPWHEYRSIFINARRVRGGVEFWRTHAATLARAEQVYGVPPEIVVAIIGVETQYGGNMGRHRVLEALATLAFDYPRRADFFRKELEAYLLLTRAEGIDPLALRGSYAGAMGWGQFMPTSYLNYAVDFDGDGRRDLWQNPRDAIGSVANYFRQHGWRPGEPVVVPARIGDPAAAGLITRRLTTPPTDSIASWRARGVAPLAPVGDRQAALLLELAGRAGPEHWLAFHNFYVITRYNRSQLYAMAVYQLSQEIREHHARS
jgi:membrane-bound lytic murein transglycosylase B